MAVPNRLRELLAVDGGRSRALVVGLRPLQWVKNVLVFAAPTASGRLFETHVLLHSLAAFVCFCLASSAVYLVNDICDRSSDAEHPRKRLRPIASGRLPVRLAAQAAALLAAASLVIAGLVAPGFLVLIAVYLVTFAAYSLWLKHVQVLDLCLVAAAFVMRAGAGGVANHIPLTTWFLLVTAFASLLVAAGKREAELKQVEEGPPTGVTRSVLEQYSASYLRQVQAVALGGSLVGYALWSIDRGHKLHGHPRVDLIHLSWVVFGVAMLRYVFDVDRGHGETPEELLFQDRFLLVCAVVWAGLFGGALL